MRVENGALSTVAGKLDSNAQVTITLTREAFDSLILKEGDVGELFASGAIVVAGDAGKLAELFGLLEEADPTFAIVTP